MKNCKKGFKFFLQFLIKEGWWLLIAISQQKVYQNKNYNRSQTTSPYFTGSVACNQCFKNIIHFFWCFFKMMY